MATAKTTEQRVGDSLVEFIDQRRHIHPEVLRNQQ